MTAQRLTTTMAEQVERFALALGRARRGEVTGVHQARVASRRIREILPLVEALETAVDDDSHRRRRKDVRRIAAALGEVRELDVTQRLLTAAAARYKWPPTVVASIISSIEEDRADRLRALVDALKRVGTRSFLRDLRRAAAGQAPDGSSLEGLMKSRRQARAAALSERLRVLGTLYVPDRLHAVRLATKKLRYSLEAQRAVKRAAVANDIRKLEFIQEQLGELHDLQVLQERIQSVPRQAHRADLRRMNADIELECRALHARVLARLPAWLTLADRIAEG
jgi:CHAD domain-containing protein